MADMCVMEVMNSYESLRSFLVRSSNDISNIETMKKRFKLSKRKLDFVTNVAVLIKILEKLGELDSFRIHPIEIINENLDNVTLKNELLQRIRAHKSLISKCSIPEHSVNLYANDVLVREHDSLSQTGERNTSNLSCTYNESCGVQNQANDVLVRERDSLSQTGERNTSNLSCTYNESSGVQNQVFKQVAKHDFCFAICEEKSHIRVKFREHNGGILSLAEN
ncbi:fas-associated death domain protein isoform X2 [Lycorma delicatula]|uniref:fas-associated death domain protein isoform X2 n=1 Tax=Lycorma delicatula TaxID=130591 RepID=UPI003F5180D6